MSMFNIFKRKRGKVMLNDEEIKALTEEQKADLIAKLTLKEEQKLDEKIKKDEEKELEGVKGEEKAIEITMTEKVETEKVETENNTLEILKVELQSEITKFKEETLETFKKELSLKDEVITSLQNDIAELKRTQPTGVPSTKYDLGTKDLEETQKKESVKNSYYSGSRYQH